MAVYEAKLKRVEAVELEDGRYMVHLGGDETTIWTRADLEDAYELVEDRRTTTERRTKPRTGKAAKERRGGRKAKPWTCAGCKAETVGAKCTNCGRSKYAKRTPATEAAEA